ncbi:MAG: amidohydrolase family protein [Pseudomonadota bacterium]
MALDIVIKGGRVYDGSGGDAGSADIGIRDGLIADIGRGLTGKQTIDADGATVTPGFIDLHTHYDGQVSWDQELKPSVNFGVTTAIFGNCGVGFAPVHRGGEDALVRLMEGVEDIPGTALHEGIRWDWESFPEYMDAIDRLPHTIDFGVMAVHDPLRMYVMGERAGCDEVATEDDIRRMHELVAEAMDAGAAGFSTGRSDVHRTSDGDWTPSSEASLEELAGIASALQGRPRGVLQAVSDFNLEREGDNFDHEFRAMESFARAGGGRPCSMSLMQRDLAPNQWRKILTETERLNADGVDFRVQVAPRAIGVFNGLQCTFHPVLAQPAYLAIRDKPLEERVAIMRDPAFKTRCLADPPMTLSGPGSPIPPIVDRIIGDIDTVAFKLFRLGAEPDYEQPAEQSLGAEAQRDGVPVMDKLYDVCLELDGRQLIYFPIYNYINFNYDDVHEMLTHPNAMLGLSDGGAHVGTICDASFPAYFLSHWTRDRERGRIDLARAVQMLTADPADYLGLRDRGRIEVGRRADLNIIDYDALTLEAPAMIQDLPAGGQRLMQEARGFLHTLVNGEVVIDRDTVTAARPGRLVRFN